MRLKARAVNVPHNHTPPCALRMFLRFAEHDADFTGTSLALTPAHFGSRVRRNRRTRDRETHEKTSVKAVRGGQGRRVRSESSITYEKANGARSPGGDRPGSQHDPGRWMKPPRRRLGGTRWGRRDYRAGVGGGIELRPRSTATRRCGWGLRRANPRDLEHAHRAAQQHDPVAAGRRTGGPVALRTKSGTGRAQSRRTRMGDRADPGAGVRRIAWPNRGVYAASLPRAS